MKYSLNQKKAVCISSYYDKLHVCKISKPNKSLSQRYPCDRQTDECEFIGHRFVKPVTNNSSWNTHPIKIRFCKFLCIMFRYLSVKFRRLMSFGYQDILIYCLNIPKYLCKSGRSKNKKINSSWNTHPTNLRFCRFLCIMLRCLCIKFQRLTSFGWQDIKYI